jgi:glutaminase
MVLNNGIDYQSLLAEIVAEVQALEDCGVVASYIPELGNVDPDKLGIHLITVDNQHFCVGDSDEKFSIQSISKVLTLAMAIELEGDELWQRVDVEPSGTPFNSLVQLEYEKGIPRNPFINAGAIVICDVLLDHLADPKQDLLAFIREMSGNPNIEYNDKVAESEMTTGYRNRSLINLIKSFGNINHDINNVLDFYFHSCAIELTCKELAQTFLFLACNGVNRLTNEHTVSASRSKRINALMQTCGFYDEAGEFSFCVGLPGKSGVGGGIVAIHPGKYSVGVWSPGLNKKGNSYRGMKVLESLTTSTQSSIF